MADVSQVEQSIVALIGQIAYPGGTANPSIIARPVKIYRGWPVPKNLDADLMAGKVNVSVYPSDAEKRTTRYAREWQELSVTPPTLTLNAAGNTLSVGGVATAGQNACAVVNGTAYIYPVQANDTPTSVATGLATQINADTGCTSSGGTLTIPGASSLSGRVGTLGTAIREIRRQRRNFQVTFWCPTPQVRDDIASAVDAALADIDYLALPDGSRGRLLYERSRSDDSSQKEGLYRRDLFYSVEYATTQVRQGATIVAPLVRLRDATGIVGKPTLSTEQPFSLLTEAGDLLLLDPAHAPSLALESGAYMLLEDGSRLLLDPAVVHDASVTLEAGGYLESESGANLLFEPVLSHEPGLQAESGAALLAENGNWILLDIPEIPGGRVFLESGAGLLSESGGLLAIDVRGAILAEAGGRVLTEDGYQLLM